jgi:hypothetical protein
MTRTANDNAKVGMSLQEAFVQIHVQIQRMVQELNRLNRRCSHRLRSFGDRMVFRMVRGNGRYAWFEPVLVGGHRMRPIVLEKRIRSRCL